MSLEQEVLGRIARERELGKEDDLGARVDGALEVPGDQLTVPVDVSDGGIDLAEG